jgi:hypothetical protein
VCWLTNDYAVTVIENGKDEALFAAVHTTFATPTFSPVTKPVLETFTFGFEDAHVTVFIVALAGRILEVS